MATEVSAYSTNPIFLLLINKVMNYYVMYFYVITCNIREALQKPCPHCQPMTD